MPIRIPFNRPFLIGKELEYIEDAVRADQLSGDGTYTQRVERFFQSRYGVERVLFTTSCTAALEMAALLCDLKPGDEVVLPSFTFVSTANAFLMRGASLRFVDIDADTLNLDPADVRRVLSPRTRVVVPVHYAGVGCDMDAIGAAAASVDAVVVEDAAQGVEATYRDRPLGSIGHLGAFSFHETKNVICGEGGALLVNDPRFLERAEIVRHKGTNRGQFLRGQVDKYTWVDVGSSYAASDVLAAFLFAQLERIDEITARRRSIHTRYAERLAPLAERGLVRLPYQPGTCGPNYHMFYLLAQDRTARDGLIEALRARGILGVFHYIPLHSSPMGLALGNVSGSLPVTESASERLIRLPFFHDLTAKDVDEVASAVAAYFGVPVAGTSARARPW